MEPLPPGEKVRRGLPGADVTAMALRCSNRQSVDVRRLGRRPWNERGGFMRERHRKKKKRSDTTRVLGTIGDVEEADTREMSSVVAASPPPHT